MSKPRPRRTWLYVMIGGLPALALIGLTVYVMTRAISDMGAGDGGRRVTEICVSRLRSVSQGVLIYAADHDGFLPPAETWVDATWPYAAKKDPEEESESVFRCPAISKLREGGYGYAFNLDLDSKPAKSDFSDSKPMVFDSKALFRNAAGPPVAAYPAPDPRHNGGKANVIAYLDGSVKVELDN